MLKMGLKKSSQHKVIFEIRSRRRLIFPPETLRFIIYGKYLFGHILNRGSFD